MLHGEVLKEFRTSQALLVLCLLSDLLAFIQQVLHSQVLDLAPIDLVPILEAPRLDEWQKLVRGKLTAFFLV